MNPHFDFRDMLGGASAKVGDGARTRAAVNRDIAIGEEMVAALQSACVSAATRHGSVGNPIGVVGYVMTRLFGAGMLISEDEGRKVLDRFRGLIDILEDEADRRG